MRWELILRTPTAFAFAAPGIAMAPASTPEAERKAPYE
jgi:hypothetical protein